MTGDDEQEAIHGAPRQKREVEVRESIKRTWIRKKKEVPVKRTTR
jgi:hypothetical protein